MKFKIGDTVFYKFGERSGKSFIREFNIYIKGISIVKDANRKYSLYIGAKRTSYMTGKIMSTKMVLTEKYLKIDYGI